MKKLLLGLAITTLSMSAFADKIVVSGDPIMLEKQGDVYVTPSTTTVTTTEDRYFFTVDNRKQVCYREVQPALASVDLGVIGVKLGTDTVNLHCYSYSPEYFVVPN